MSSHKKYFSWLHLALMAAILLNFMPSMSQPVYAQEACSASLPPLLQVASNAQVFIRQGESLPVYADPSSSSSQLGELAPNTTLLVTAGPECVEGVYWWQIESESLSGWIHETVDGAYVVLPLLADAPVGFQWDWETYQTIMPGVSPDPFLITPPDAYAGNMPTLPIDLSSVSFVEESNLSDAQKALLAQNGFVVVPMGEEQFNDAYSSLWDHLAVEVERPYDPAYFITTDSMLHALHYIFSNLLSDLELGYFLPMLSQEVLLPLTHAAHEQRLALVDTELADAAQTLELYLAVALELFLPSASQSILSPEDAAIVQELVALAQSAEGTGEIAFLDGLREDFSQYRPRGMYAGDPNLENYFRGMMWLGRITLFADNPTQTQAALLLLHLLNQSPYTADILRGVYDTQTFLIGPADDLTLLDYQRLATSLYPDGLSPDALADTELLAQFMAAVTGLPAPRVNSLVLPDDSSQEDLAATKGFRLLGQRFTLDGFMMQQLMWPYVGDDTQRRLLPLGLDVPAVLGSEQALSLLDEMGETDFAHYSTQIELLQNEIGTLDSTTWLENTYSAWLWSLVPLIQRDAAAYPPMMNTDAWQLKDLQTMLASWTELKHDTVLYVKQPTGFGGGGAPLSSFGSVEANPLVFARLAMVAALTYQGLYDVLNLDEISIYDRVEWMGLAADMSELNQFTRHALTFAQIANKELHGEALTDNDYWPIFTYGSYLYTLLYSLYQGDGQPDPVALITDVASNPSIGLALQEGVGGVDYIYVVIPDNQGGLQLTLGGVFSYYEFTHDINQRLTNEEWRAMLAAGDAPDRPTWTSAFIAE